MSGKSNFSRRCLLGGAAPLAAIALAAAPAIATPAPFSQAAPVALPEEARSRRVKAHHIAHAGKLHKVNVGWHRKHTAPWPHLASLAHEELWVEAHRLQRLADERGQFGGGLNSKERAYLVAVNTHINVRRGLILLKGRDISDFGFTGHDQVCHNLEHLPCGCRRMYVFDGEKIRAVLTRLFKDLQKKKARTGGEITKEDLQALGQKAGELADVEHHPTHAAFLCPRHEHLEGTTDYVALRDRLLADNRLV